MKKHFYGGQAVIEGVMIRGITNCVVAVRNKKKEIVINQINLPSFTNSKFKKIPFIIGLFILFVMYDTKLIQVHAKNCKEKTVDYINESLGLFIDALNLFQSLVNVYS